MSEELKDILEEISKNIKSIVLANRQQIEKEKKDFLDVSNNRKILNSCNGKRQIKEIAKRVKMSPRMVLYVIDQLDSYGFVSLLKAPSGKAKLPKKI